MKVLAVSPHLDDAVFSAGATLARHARQGDDVTVLTCLTGNVARPEGFALACQLDKGLSPDVDYMALRRAEDRAACAAIGAQAVHWHHLEAPHRGYEDAPALFAAARADDPLEEALARDFEALFASLEYDVIYGPWGVGGHVDHLAVRRALESCRSDIVWWEDFPYAMRETAAPSGIERQCVSPQDLACKVDAALCYASQLDFQFGSPAKARAVLREWTVEGFAR